MELKKPHLNYHFDRMEPYFEKYGEKSKYYIDDLTFFDLNLDKVEETIDYTYTAPGSYRLYEILRNPVHDRLEKRVNFIEKLKDNEELRNKLTKILRSTGEEYIADYTFTLFNRRKVNPGYFYYVLIFNLAFIICLIIGLYTLNSNIFLIGLIIQGLGSLLTSYIDNKIKVEGETDYKVFGGIVEYEMSSLNSLSNIMYGASKIYSEPELVHEVSNFKKSFEEVKDFSSNLKIYNILKSSDIIGSILTIFFKVNYLIYLKTINKLNLDSDKIFKLTKEFGEYDALLSFTNIILNKEANGEIVCMANLNNSGNEKYLEVTDMVHPLVKNAVANSIKIEDESVLITGSNMSGKSTFLKGIGINAVLSQTFGYAFCKSYRASIFNIMSSITPEDDITSKKSYFLSEAEAIKRLIDNENDEYPSLFIIDEIFRGTNPEERIASSANIIDYLASKRVILLVSTHDLDMISLLKNKYKKVYFKEEITNNNIVFNYKINDGVAQGTNAVKVLELIGYPKEIIDNTITLVNKIRSEKDRDSN